jgi:hypothetical protein
MSFLVWALFVVLKKKIEKLKKERLNRLILIKPKINNLKRINLNIYRRKKQ